MEGVNRLRELRGAGSADFAAQLANQTTPDASLRDDRAEGTGPEDALRGGPLPLATRTGDIRRKQGAKDVYSQLEAFIMQSFIQSMLPKDAASVYGKGTAGQVWKSMLAEKMGAEIARSGQLGIAKRLQNGSPALAAVSSETSPLAMTTTMRSLRGDLSRAPNALANALANLQETGAATATASAPRGNPWATGMTVAEHRDATAWAASVQAERG